VDLLDLAGEELTLAAAHDTTSDAATGEQEEIHAWCPDVGARIEHHRGTVQPGGGAIRDDRVRRHDQAEALDPQREAVGQLRGVQNAVDRGAQETRPHPGPEPSRVNALCPGRARGEPSIDRDRCRSTEERDYHNLN